MNQVIAILLLTSATLAAQSDTIVLNEIGEKNLRIETAVVGETDFEETFFSLGHIEALPENVAAVSSRIPGRVVELTANPGDTVAQGDEVARIESRQPGDPPPVISLKSPIGGLVTNREIRLGDPVTADAALMEITDLSQVHAIAKVPEHLAGKMAVGTKAHIRVIALPDEDFAGQMIRFGTRADEESGTIDAIFLLPNTGNRLRSGMRAEFSIVLNERPGVMTVPRAALQGEAAERFVYVKHFDLPHAYVKAPVILGLTNDRQVEVVSGLFPGDEVVTRGAYSLSFAGASSLSLKDALDAAHGHEHAEDGSELTGDAKPDADEHDDHEGHDHGEPDKSGSALWMYATILLALLLIASLVGRRTKTEADA